MTIKENVLKPERMQANEVDFGTSIAQWLWSKIANYHNWTESNIPIGSLMYFHGSQTYADGSPIEKPNDSLWVLCDGSQIVDVNSPLNGMFTPALNDMIFLKGGNVVGETGGQDTINLSHNHGTNLVSENDESGTSNARLGGDYRAGSPHTHTIATQWSSAEPIIPPHRQLQIYMRKK
jgi:hypothetical protein